MLSLTVVLFLIDCCIEGQTRDTKLLQRPGRSRCPLGFIQYKSSCYLFSHNTATYAEALSFCGYFGGRLTEISSRNEDDFMRGYLKRKGGGFSYYIGGTDLHIEGIWTWENPLRRISYLNWNGNQPDNSGGKEHCLDIAASYGYKMNDLPCEKKLRFVCVNNI